MIEIWYRTCLTVHAGLPGTHLHLVALERAGISSSNLGIRAFRSRSGIAFSKILEYSRLISLVLGSGPRLILASCALPLDSALRAMKISRPIGDRAIDSSQHAFPH